MVDKKILTLISGQDIEIKRISNNSTTEVIELNASRDNFQITLVYVNKEIYSVLFLNNEYFELRNSEDLYSVIEGILHGAYTIYKTGFLKRIKAIKIDLHDKQIYPERVYSDKQYRDSYLNLPVKF